MVGSIIATLKSKPKTKVSNFKVRNGTLKHELQKDVPYICFLFDIYKERDLYLFHLTSIYFQCFKVSLQGLNVVGYGQGRGWFNLASDWVHNKPNLTRYFRYFVVKWLP